MATLIRMMEAPMGKETAITEGEALTFGTLSVPNAWLLDAPCIRSIACSIGIGLTSR